MERGELPHISLRALQPNLTMRWDLDGDGLTTDDVVVARFDIDGDGKREPLTEQQLENEFTRKASTLDDDDLDDSSTA